ncbi:hypothetical protein MZD04_gp079 [Pseudomonas phage Psa21]|uniref:Uncharacterized protein n=1 Tax=Pseudomonas phage Psa21 TaxID=2530023 RepID=A0A481W4Q7_9CAUD|nr:hypothetical protein MZD04_gp079 [Pseudomonas phage Psa21]QBJ02608.1 hypothetical protein PSA21_79 [Pseudomonas phage Psa21]
MNALLAFAVVYAVLTGYFYREVRLAKYADIRYNTDFFSTSAKQHLYSNALLCLICLIMAIVVHLITK